MNRRDLFRGAGAVALTAAVPAPPVEAFTGITARYTGLDLGSEPSTSIWFVAYGNGGARMATPEENERISRMFVESADQGVLHW